MRSLFYFLLLPALLIPISCLKKNESPKKHPFPGPPNLTKEEITISDETDSDRDGLSNVWEKENNLSNQIAHFPSLSLGDAPLTELTLVKKTNNYDEFKWQTQEHLRNRLPLHSYFDRPTRTSLAQQIYKTDYLLQDSPLVNTYMALPSFKLSLPTSHELFKMQTFIENHQDESLALQVRTELSLRWIYTSGIESLADIKAELGYWKDGEFHSLTSQFDLKNKAKERVKFEVRRPQEQAILSFMIEDKELIHQILESSFRLSLRILDFKVRTSEDFEYQFTKQWKYAAEKLHPLFISTSSEDRALLYLKDPQKTNRENLKTLYPNMSFNSSGEIESFMDLNGYRSYQNDFSKMNQEQLNEATWYDLHHPSISFISHFTQTEIAQAVSFHRENKKLEIKSDKEIMIRNLKEEEVITFKLQGQYLIPSLVQKERAGKITYTQTQCHEPQPRCPLWNPHCQGSIPKSGSNCRTHSFEISCKTRFNDLSWEEKNLDDPESLELKDQYGKKIGFEELSEIVFDEPFYHEKENQIFFQIKITPEFIKSFGRYIRINIREFFSPRQWNLGREDYQCAESLPQNSRNIKYFIGEENIEIVSQRVEADLEILRSF